MQKMVMITLQRPLDKNFRSQNPYTQLESFIFHEDTLRDTKFQNHVPEHYINLNAWLAEPRDPYMQQ